VQRIVRGLGAIDSLVARSAVRRTSRGVTTGRHERAFRACDGTAGWEFHSDLWSRATYALAHIRAALPPAINDTTARDTARRDTTALYTVEVDGEMSPGWLARQ
jgi:hypothetical protein